MQHPVRALLPCLLLVGMGVAPAASAQDADGVQDLPRTLPYAISPLPSTTPAAPTLMGSYVRGDQGFTGDVHAAAIELRQDSAAVQGPAPTRILRAGDKGEDVQWLIEALIARGYLTQDANPRRSVGPVVAPQSLPTAPQFSSQYTSVLDLQSEFTPQVEMAVRAFQVANGLKEDGIAGNGLYSALTVDNTALANALDSWAINVATWADQARAQGYTRMIVVNVPSFTLHAIDLSNNAEALQSRVIVGKPQTKTPLMMTRVVNLKANPDWSPPKSIRGARYQPPGPKNALGLMRFSTDNNMNIYLHDTNSRGLFANDHRSLSHGCVRVQQWRALAGWVAGRDDQWVDEVALAGGKMRFLKVDAVPVVITYSLVDLVEGKPRQFQDIYNRQDRAIGYAALRGLPENPPGDWTQDH